MKILFFSPHNYYLTHALPEALVAESLIKKGSEIIFVGCNGVLNSYCLCMSAIKSNSEISEKNNICKTCKLFRNKIYNEFKVKSILIDDFISQDEINKINSLLNKIDINNIQEFKYLNYEVGKISLYEFLLNRKLNTTNVNYEEFDEFKLYVKNTLITLFAGIKIFKEYDIDRLVTYNSYYSVNNMMCSIAIKNNVPHYMLHAGSHHKYRLTEMTIFKGLTEPFLINQNEKWYEYSKSPISKESIRKTYEHVLFLLKTTSPWVYSIKSKNINEFDLKKKIGINDNQKVLLALMSSADERYAANMIGALPIYQESLFPSQIHWIKYLIDLTRNDTNLFLIIRVHPREFPNKRENVLSKQAKELSNLFINLPHNCFINYPSDQISLHDLIKITDVGLNATSTAGLELLLFGIPVIIYDSNQLFSYAKEINIIANDLEDYKIKIYEAIKRGHNINYVISAFRWIAFKSEVVSIDISDGYTTNNNYFRRITTYLKNIFSNSTSFTSLKNRNKNLKEIDKLTYAILNNKISHINSFVLNTGNNSNIEKKLVIKYFKIYVKKILNKYDKNYKEKIYKMVN